MRIKDTEELYAIAIREGEVDGVIKKSIYSVGRSLYENPMVYVEEITLEDNLVIVAFSDETKMVIGYNPMVIQLFIRKKEVKEEGEEGTNA